MSQTARETPVSVVAPTAIADRRRPNMVADMALRHFGTELLSLSCMVLSPFGVVDEQWHTHVR